MATPAAPPMLEPAPTRPAWGWQTSLWQWRQPAFYFFSIPLLLSILGSLLIQITFIAFSPAGWLLSWVLLLIYAVPVFIFIRLLDLYEREPMSLVFGALLWGAFAATLLSVISQTGWAPLTSTLLGENAFDWSAAVLAPPTEEIFKGAAVIFVYLIARQELDDVMDGFVYGAMAGLGFTIVEDVLYFLGIFGGDIAGVLEGFYVRVIASGLYGHVLYSGVFGMGVAYFVTRRHEATLAKRLLVAGGLIFLSMFAHFLWNSPLLNFFPLGLEGAGDYLQWILGAAVKGVPLLLFTVLMVVLARRREHRWLRVALSGEVGKPGLYEEELRVLERPKVRRRARREMSASRGALAGQTLKRLQRAQIDLAMIRTRVQHDEHPDLLRQREYCRALRQWLEHVAGVSPGGWGHRGWTGTYAAPQAQPPAQPQP